MTSSESEHSVSVSTEVDSTVRYSTVREIATTKGSTVGDDTHAESRPPLKR